MLRPKYGLRLPSEHCVAGFRRNAGEAMEIVGGDPRIERHAAEYAMWQPRRITLAGERSARQSSRPGCQMKKISVLQGLIPARATRVVVYLKPINMRLGCPKLHELCCETLGVEPDASTMFLFTRVRPCCRRPSMKANRS